MTFLIDTNILSAAAPGKPAFAPALAAWMEAASDQLYLSAMTIAEFEQGIAKLHRAGAARRVEQLTAWLASVLRLYGGRILPLDVGVAHRLGQLADYTRAIGRPTGLADLIIAATALRHGCMVLTRNLKHFKPLGIAAHDPFEGLPPH